MHETCHIYEWVMAHIYAWVMPHINETCHTYEVPTVSKHHQPYLCMSPILWLKAMGVSAWVLQRIAACCNEYTQLHTATRCKISLLPLPAAVCWITSQLHAFIHAACTQYMYTCIASNTFIIYRTDATVVSIERLERRDAFISHLLFVMHVCTLHTHTHTHIHTYTHTKHTNKTQL